MEQYLPEGRRKPISEQEHPREALLQAIQTREILEATVMMCDEHHNLTVELGDGLVGIIPREEAALGIREGTTRDVALLAKVGKPVCFQVEAACGREHFRLSRRSAQTEALRYILDHRRCGEILHATVTSIAPFGVFCDIGCGVMALLERHAVSVSVANRLSERFHIGDNIYTAISKIDYATGRIWLTHRELLGTWKENAARFRSGQTVTGIVRSKMDYGIFIELTPNLSGLAEPTEDCHLGDTVSVYIKSIQPDKGKIKLVVVENLGTCALTRPMVYTKTEGNVGLWQYDAENFPRIQSDFLISSQ